MSDPTPSSPPPPPPPPPPVAEGELHSKQPPPPPDRDIVRDVFQWRRKKLSILVLLVATATWVVMEVYNYNFIPVVSYVGMAISASLFIWASILRVMGKETPSLSALEIPEQTAIEMGHSVTKWIEEGIQWMFRIGAEGELFVFAGAVVALWLFSHVAKFCDLLNLLYIGIVAEMTVPAIYMRYEHKIKEYRNRIRVQCERLYDMINERVVQKVKNMAVGKKKEKKVE